MESVSVMCAVEMNVEEEEMTIFNSKRDANSKKENNDGKEKKNNSNFSG